MLSIVILSFGGDARGLMIRAVMLMIGWVWFLWICHLREEHRLGRNKIFPFIFNFKGTDFFVLRGLQSCII